MDNLGSDGESNHSSDSGWFSSDKSEGSIIMIYDEYHHNDYEASSDAESIDSLATTVNLDSSDSIQDDENSADDDDNILFLHFEEDEVAFFSNFIQTLMKKNSI